MTSSFTIPGSSDKPISLDLTSENEKHPMVIFAHGFKGFKDWGTHSLTAKYFAGHGLQYLKFNFSHNGISPHQTDTFDDLEGFSNNNFSKELFDLDEVITFALSGESFKAPPQLFVVGHSMGAAISIIQTSEDKRISKLACWASISSFRNLWKPEQEKQWLQEGVLHFTNTRTKQNMPINVQLLEDLEHNSERFDILAAARKLDQPWLIIHGADDSSVTVEHAQELHRQKKESLLEIIPGADHVFNARHPWTHNELPPKLKEVCDLTIGFFKSGKA